MYFLNIEKIAQLSRFDIHVIVPFRAFAAISRKVSPIKLANRIGRAVVSS